MKEEEIDRDERVKVVSIKPTTANYNLIKPDQTDFYDVDDFNSNMDTVDEQLKENADQIKILEEQVNNLDVSQDVEEVVNRRLNPDTSKPLSTLISGWVDASKTTILNAISALTTHVTAARDNTNNHITSQHTATKNTVNVARDNIKAHVTAEKNAIISSVNSTVADGGKVYRPNKINVIATICDRLVIPLDTKSRYMGKFIPKYNGTLMLQIHSTHSTTQMGRIQIYRPLSVTHFEGDRESVISPGIDFEELAQNTIITSYINSVSTGIYAHSSNYGNKDVYVPVMVRKGHPMYFVGTHLETCTVRILGAEVVL